MTAVVRLFVNQVPILIGDLLLAGPRDPKRRIILPTTDVIPIRDQQEKEPVGLCQKIAIVDNYCAIGWTGTRTIAQDVIGDLVMRSKSERLTLPLLDEHFNRQRSTVWEEIGLVGYIREDDHTLGAFSRSSCFFSSQEFGEVHVLGTGAERLAEDIRLNEQALRGLEQPGLPDHAIFFAMALTGIFLNTEIATLKSLMNLYGGGYEIAYITASGEFLKLDGVTYIFWVAKFDGKEVALEALPRLAFGYRYYNDLLVVRSWEPRETDGVLTHRENIYPVAPVHRYLTANERQSPPLPDMNGKWLCNYVLVLHPTLPPDWLCIGDCRPDCESWVKFESRGENILFDVDGRLIERIAREILANPAYNRKNTSHMRPQ